MRKRLAIMMASIVVLALVLVISSSRVRSVEAQGKTGAGFAAIPGTVGGQDVFGAYDVVKNWPQDISTLPGNKDWTWGAGQSVYAENPNRVFLLFRGELPNIKRPQTKLLPDFGPSIQFPDRPFAVARCHGLGAARRRRHRPGPRRRTQAVEGHRRCRRQVGALPDRGRRQRQHHRALDPVGQDLQAPALRHHQSLRSRKTRVGGRRSHARHLQVHPRRQAAGADHRHAHRQRRGWHALQPADVPRVAARQHHVRRRRLQRHPRREVRQGWQVPAGLGPEGHAPRTTSAPAT